MKEVRIFVKNGKERDWMQRTCGVVGCKEHGVGGGRMGDGKGLDAKNARVLVVGWEMGRGWTQRMCGLVGYEMGRVWMQKTCGLVRWEMGGVGYKERVGVVG